MSIMKYFLSLLYCALHFHQVSGMKFINQYPNHPNQSSVPTIASQNDLNNPFIQPCSHFAPPIYPSAPLIQENQSIPCQYCLNNPFTIITDPRITIPDPRIEILDRCGYKLQSTEELSTQELSNDLSFVNDCKALNASNANFNAETFIKLLHELQSKDSQQALLFYCSDETKGIEHKAVNKNVMVTTADTVKTLHSSTLLANTLPTIVKNNALLSYLKSNPNTIFSLGELQLLEKIKEEGAYYIKKNNNGTYTISSDLFSAFIESIRKPSSHFILLQFSLYLMMFSLLPIQNWKYIQYSILLYWFYMGCTGKCIISTKN